MQNQFIKELLKLISEDAGCSIQHGGCPCNTCFHFWAQDELGLNGNFAHLFWLVVLALRGDYTENELVEHNREWWIELSKGRLGTKGMTWKKKALNKKEKAMRQSANHY